MSSWSAVSRSRSYPGRSCCVRTAAFASLFAVSGVTAGAAEAEGAAPTISATAQPRLAVLNAVKPHFHVEVMWPVRFASPEGRTGRRAAGNTPRLDARRPATTGYLH